MLAKFIIRITVLGLPKIIRQKYLRAWLAELEHINQETPEESWAFATSLFWNIPKMRKIEIKKPLPVRRPLGRLLLTGSTLAAVLVVLIQWSSLPKPISSTPSQDRVETASDFVKLEENRDSSESINELDSEYMLNSVQNLSEINDEGIPAGEFTITSNTEALEMESGERDPLELGAIKGSQGILSSIQNQPEDREEAFAEGFFALEENSLEMQSENVNEQVLSAGEVKQKEMILKQSLRKLAQDYLVSKKVSKKEAAEFVEILSALLELDKKTTKNYLDNLLKQAP